MKKRILCLMLLVLTVLAVSVLCLASCDEEPTPEYIRVTFKVGETVSDVQWPSDALNASNYRAAKPEIPFGHTFEGWYSLDGVKYFDADGKKVPDLLIDRDILLAAKFTPKEFSFVFGSGDRTFADGTNEKRVAYTYGTLLPDFPAPEIADPTIELDGYFDAEGTRYSNGTVPVAGTLNTVGYPNLSAETELTAVYRPRTVTLVIDYNDGTLETETLELAYGVPLPDLAVYGKDTGTESIVSWSANPYNAVELPETLTEDLRIYAVWQRYKTVNFVLPGGSERGEKIFEDTNRIALPTFDVPGYKLLGWYLTNSLSGNKVEEVHYANMQDAYYGDWQMTDYSIAFEGKNITLDGMRYYYGDYVALPTPEVEGYTFYGWYLDDPENPFFTLPDSVWGDITLQAKLTPNNYSVILHPDGGEIANNFHMVEYGSNFTVPTPKREGYVFLGWYDAPRGGNQITTARGVGLAPWSSAVEDKDLYAYWEIMVYNVIFMTDGGTGVSPVKVEHGGALTLPKPPKKTGVLFHGWFNEDFTVEYKDGTIITASTVLYAKWIESTPIFDAEDLLAIRNNPSGNYHLMDDINMGNATWSMISEFTGILDGQGYKIYNLLLTNSSVDNYAMISTNKGIIRNLNLEEVTYNYTRQSATCASILVALNRGTIQNCRITNSDMICRLSYNTTNAGVHCYAGVMVGYNYGTISGCYTEITMTAHVTTLATWHHNSDKTLYYTNIIVGGLAGGSNGTVIGCESASTVYGYGNATSYGKIHNMWQGVNWPACDAEARVWIGGLIGLVSGGKVESSTATGYSCAAPYSMGATRTNNFSVYAGGLAAYVSGGTVTRCYSAGTIEWRGGGWAGGFTSVVSGSTVSNCYAETVIKSISGGNIAGFVGSVSGIVLDCYANTDGGYGFVHTVTSTGNVRRCFTTRTNFVGSNSGIVDKCFYAGDVSEGSKKTAEELMSTGFLLDTLYWDASVWVIDGEDLPTLRGLTDTAEEENGEEAA